MRRQRRVKVVATLGPASSPTEMIERLFLAGVDVFRINMSHSSHETARALQNSVRWVAKRHRHPIGSAKTAELPAPFQVWFEIEKDAGRRDAVPCQSLTNVTKPPASGLTTLR